RPPPPASFACSSSASISASGRASCRAPSASMASWKPICRSTSPSFPRCQAMCKARSPSISSGSRMRAGSCCGPDGWKRRVAPAAMLDAALNYAEHGAPVFPVWWTADRRCACDSAPCESPGKHPIPNVAPNGFKNASTDPATIRGWWARFPRAHIGTPTSWCVVLDVDPRHGGDVTPARLEAAHGALPPTAEVLTGGGGRHLYFERVNGLRSRIGVPGPGLDLRADGGYVLLPPSGHISGGTYREVISRPLFETPLAPMPAWLVAGVMRSTAPNRTEPAEAMDWAGLLAGAPAGERHAVAVRLAGHYLRHGIPPAEVESILVGFCARCTPPFPENEARRIVQDLAAKEARGRTQPVNPASREFEFRPIADLLAQPDVPLEWLVEGLFPREAISLLAGRPKSGKTTLCRTLAADVVSGTSFLGRATVQGSAIYVSLEDSARAVTAHFRRLGVATDASLYVVCAQAPPDALQILRREVDARP